MLLLYSFVVLLSCRAVASSTARGVAARLWKDNFDLTHDRDRLSSGDNLIYAIAGSDQFLNETLHGVLAAYQGQARQSTAASDTLHVVDLQCMDLIDTTNPIKTFEEAIKESRKTDLTDTVGGKASWAEIFVVSNFEKLNTAAELKKLDFLFRVTDKSYHYSNIVVVLLWNTDVSPFGPLKSPESSVSVTNNIAAKEFLAGVWSKGAPLVNGDALVGRISRIIVDPSPSAASSAPTDGEEDDERDIRLALQAEDAALSAAGVMMNCVDTRVSALDESAVAVYNYKQKMEEKEKARLAAEAAAAASTPMAKFLAYWNKLKSNVTASFDKVKVAINDNVLELQFWLMSIPSNVGNHMVDVGEIVSNAIMYVTFHMHENMQEVLLNFGYYLNKTMRAIEQFGDQMHTLFVITPVEKFGEVRSSVGSLGERVLYGVRKHIDLLRSLPPLLLLVFTEHLKRFGYTHVIIAFLVSLLISLPVSVYFFYTPSNVKYATKKMNALLSAIKELVVSYGLDKMFQTSQPEMGNTISSSSSVSATPSPKRAEKTPSKSKTPKTPKSASGNVGAEAGMDIDSTKKQLEPATAVKSTKKSVSRRKSSVSIGGSVSAPAAYGGRTDDEEEEENEESARYRASTGQVCDVYLGTRSKTPMKRR
jgi:hypothetical protein